MAYELINTTENANSFYKPSVRNCYYDGEFNLKYYSEENTYGYSMGNCLYEAALTTTLKNCSCVPAWKGVVSGYEMCRGKTLLCAEKVIINLS